MLNKWMLVNQYRRLSEVGLVQWPTCDVCHAEYITLLGENDDPKFWCPVCDSEVYPGLWVYDQMAAAVAEYNN